MANHERKVLKQLSERSIETFLPVYESIRQWKDRKVKLEMPLFPGYLFVKIPLTLSSKVLSVPGAARLVGAPHKPSPLDQREIDALRDARTLKIRTDPFRYLTRGTRVRLKSGPFRDLEGYLVQRRGDSRFVVSLDQISSSFVLDIEGCELERVTAVRKRSA